MTAIAEVLRELLLRTKPELPLPLPPDRDWVDWGLDSLDLAELAARIEQRFRLEIPDDDWRRLRTFTALHDYLQAAVNGDA